MTMNGEADGHGTDRARSRPTTPSIVPACARCRLTDHDGGAPTPPSTEHARLGGPAASAPREARAAATLDGKDAGLDRPSVAILHVAGQNGAAEHQAERVHDGVALAPFDLLGRIVAHRVDPAAPLSAPFTLWLSTIAVVGLASLPAISRACS